MASGSFDSDGSHIQYSVTEWWDSSGTHHDFSPDSEQLLDAKQVTVHVTDDIGNDLYFTDFSNDGWESDELQADTEDAYAHYA